MSASKNSVKSTGFLDEFTASVLSPISCEMLKSNFSLDSAMSLEEKFKQYLGEWKQHCESVAFSSNPNDYIDCDAYRNIVEMGQQTLPLIRKVFYDEPTCETLCPLGLAHLVKNIVGDAIIIPENLREKVKDAENYMRGWLDGYLSRVIKNEISVYKGKISFYFTNDITEDVREKFMKTLREKLGKKGIIF